MFTLVSVDTHAMTKDMAIYVSGLKKVPGERDLSTARLFHLDREIKQGNVTTFRWAIAKVAGSNVEYRINGQHTSYIFAHRSEHKGTIVLERYNCDSIDDVVSLWSRYDASFSSRSRNEVLNAATSVSDELQKLPKKQLRCAAGALSIVEYGDGFASKVSHFEKSQLAVNNSAFIKWACTVINDRRYYKVGVFVALLFTYRESAEKAKEFWAETQDGTNQNPNSASRTLQKVMFEHDSNVGSGARFGKKSLKWDQFAELAITAWKSWIDGRDIKFLRLSKEGISKYLDVAKSSNVDDVLARS